MSRCRPNKNFGLLYENPQKVWMAPVYDMLSMGIYAPRTQEGDADDTMALSFNGTKQWLTSKAIDALATLCTIPGKRKAEILQNIAGALRATAADIDNQIDEQPDFFGQAGCRMLAVWAHGAAELDPELSKALQARSDARGAMIQPDADFLPKRERLRW